MHIRKASIDDLRTIMKIYSVAQDFMIESGNPTQWGHRYPNEKLVKEDIDEGISYIVCDDEEVHGVFVLAIGREPTYQHIENGRWLNDNEYATIHRIASDGKAKGIFSCAIEYSKGKLDNIRIDTHYDNLIMQKLIERHGFRKCGIIHVADGTPRIAYQWTR